MNNRTRRLAILASAGLLLAAFYLYRGADEPAPQAPSEPSGQTRQQPGEGKTQQQKAAPIAKEAKTGAAITAEEEQNGMYKKLVLEVNGVQKPFDWSNVTSPSYLPEMYALDMNKDGKDELLVVLTTGHGTGVRESRVHVLDPEALTETAVDNPLETIRKHMKTAVTEEGIDIAIGAGSSSVRLDRQAFTSEPANWFDELGFGSIVRYEIRNNELVAELPAQLSPADFIGEATLTYSYRNGRYSPYRLEFTGGSASMMLPVD